MSEFLKIYRDYFDLGISNNAILLFSFIEGRVSISEFEYEKEPYIFFVGVNNPKDFFGWSRNTFRRALDELKDNGLISLKYISGSKNKKAVFINNTQKSDILKSGTHKYPKVRHIDTQKSDIPLNNNRLSNRLTKKINSTNTSVLSNTNSIDGMAYKNVNSRIPSYEDVKKFSIENNLNFSIQDFIDYYEQRNWSINGEPIKSWKALAHSWSDKQFVRDSRLFGDDSYYFVMSLPEELQQAIYDDQCRNAKGWIRNETKKLVDEYLENQHRVTAIVEYSQKVGGINE